METLIHYIRYGLIFDRKYIYAARMIQELKNILLDLNCHNTVQLTTIQLNTKAQLGPAFFLQNAQQMHPFLRVQIIAAL